MVFGQTVQASYQLTDYILHHALIAIIPDAGNSYIPAISISDIHVGALGRVKRVAHANIFHIGTLLKGGHPKLGGIAKQYRVGISYSCCNLMIIFWNIGGRG